MLQLAGLCPSRRGLAFIYEPSRVLHVAWNMSAKSMPYRNDLTFTCCSYRPSPIDVPTNRPHIQQKHNVSSIDAHLPTRTTQDTRAVADAAVAAPPRTWRYCTSPHHNTLLLALSRPHHF
jgi:hypothetical protein